MAVVGIDVGSLSTESVILNGDNQILTHDIRFTGASIGKVALVSFREALSLAQLKAEDISYIVATGYGRQAVSFANTQVTEISCQAKGVHFLFPDVKTIIDVGVEERIAATGGVAKNRGVVAALQNILGTELLIPNEPQITGALGAALIAQEKMLQGNSRNENRDWLRGRPA